MGFYRSITKVTFKKGGVEETFKNKEEAVEFYAKLTNKKEWAVLVYTSDFCSLDMTGGDLYFETNWKIFERMKRCDWKDFDPFFGFNEGHRGLIIATTNQEFITRFEQVFGCVQMDACLEYKEMCGMLKNNVVVKEVVAVRRHSVRADFTIDFNGKWNVQMRRLGTFIYDTLDEVMELIESYDRTDAISD